MTEKYIIACSLKGTEYICATFKIEMLKTFSLEFVVFILTWRITNNIYVIFKRGAQHHSKPVSLMSIYNKLLGHILHIFDVLGYTK